MSKKGDKSKDEGKKGKKGKDAKGVASGPSVAGHPRASYQVRRAKGWGGLAGFAVAAYLSHKAGVPTFDLGVRAIGAGIAGYMLAWGCAVTVWRHLVLAEMRAALERSAPAGDADLIPARSPERVHNAAPAGEVTPAALPDPAGAPAS